MSPTKTSLAVTAAAVILLGMATAAGPPRSGTAPGAFSTGTGRIAPDNIVCARRAALERVLALEQHPEAFQQYFMDASNGCLSLEPGTPVLIDEVRFGAVRFHIEGDPRPLWTERDDIR